ncbi:MAG: hypothetical protein AcusKO_01120 [Acuticoccus sp.]
MRVLSLMAACAMTTALTTAPAMARPDIVDGPGYMPECFAPWSDDTKYFQWSAKEGPYKIALVNGFVGNIWRIQMIQTAKAFAEQPRDRAADRRVQGGIDGHRRRRAARRDRRLHQSGL